MSKIGIENLIMVAHKGHWNLKILDTAQTHQFTSKNMVILNKNIKIDMLKILIKTKMITVYIFFLTVINVILSHTQLIITVQCPKINHPG